MNSVIWFDDADADEKSFAGGKGANLARLTKAGFHVPPGFVVTTHAYAEFLTTTGVEKKIADIVGELDYNSADKLEAATVGIRELFKQAAMPAELSVQIKDAYRKLGTGLYVAVRSSGAAEDLAEGSFAGLHDTYLDIRGDDAVVDAVKRCWASLWTARATFYRQTKGFDHSESPIAVVVQIMVEADVAGVMFTANPMTAATDELVINASWGLGEAVVSGVVTPDEYVVRTGDLSVKSKTPGEKKIWIRRDREGNSGTITEAVDEAKQRVFSLSDDNVADLAALGRRVEFYYHGIPQDTEWAFANGEFYLLQSRPVTGVEFSWDCDLEQKNKFAAEGQIWDRAWADEGFTGAITPLFYTTRGWNLDKGMSWTLRNPIGDNETSRLQHFKYYKGELYYNTTTEKAITLKTIWPWARRNPLNWGGPRFIEPEAREEICKSPFNWPAYIWMQLRMQMRRATSWHGNIKVLYEDYVNSPHWDVQSFPIERARRFSDDQLLRFIQQHLEEEYHYFEDIWIGFNHLRDGINLLCQLVATWYDGDNPSALADLLTGVPSQSATVKENVALWDLSEQIRHSPALRERLAQHQGPAFFVALENCDEGKKFLADYHDFLKKFGHRGHSDRDIYYSRRAEDPWIDYRSLQAILSVKDSINPAVREKDVNHKREGVIDDVMRNIGRKALGTIKAQIFRVVLDFVQKWLVLRDDERASLDRHTYNSKRLFLEVARRIRERGLLAGERDFYFLGKDELLEVLGGYANMDLMKAKIAGRMRNFDRLNSKQITPPPYLLHGLPYDPEAAKNDDGASLRGTSQSRGSITGRARIVTSLEHIGRVKDGDILVCNSTDPGWTPVFLVIKGIVTETGGVLSHAACLSREYGLPAVQIPNAMQRIADGAIITVNGDLGEVRIESEPQESAAE